ncbi:helix-turn-helix domain-containing protein [Pseudoroseicyclus aestuarii]|uniref:helix-turn-helix domain-containing protein n=1 Tax=Pseudoroseicyclus aestuarii TaxID=1795041 RepID=UPI000DA238FC|nr:helix-turn-helix transcriptional regulator [Pseudoroseicyclus aestuarii]
MVQSSFVEKLRRVIDSDPNLTAAGLAVRAGLDNSAIRSLLTGRAKNPRWDTIEKICAALGTSVEEFMGSPQTPEERDILRLVSQLPVDLRRQLLGYGQGLLASQDQSPPPPAEDAE